MKRGLLITLIIVAALVVVIVITLFGGMGYIKGMTISPVDLSQVADGTYRGDFSRGRWKFAVEVSLANHRIETIRLTDSKQESDLTRKIVEAIVAKQSVILDAVSGASISTKAFAKAVENALESKK
jgi:uncharacterized protein with FMN-binding domain